MDFMTGNTGNQDYSTGVIDTGLSSTNPSAGAGDPASMGGTPAVMTSNDWWKSGTDLVKTGLATAADIAKSRSISGIAAPAGTLSSSPQNPAPGSLGLWFQNAATPGASSVNNRAVSPGMSSGMLLAAGLAVVLVLVYLARR
jgi:hypothetical protein